MKFLPFLFLLASFTLFSQDIEIQKGELFPAYPFEFEVVGESDSLIYTCQYSNIYTSNKSFNAKVQIIDKDLNTKESIEVFTLEKKDEIIGIFYRNDKYQVFFERYDRSIKRYTLYSADLDKENKISPNITKIESVIDESKNSAKQRFNVRWSNEIENYIIESFQIDFRKMDFNYNVIVNVVNSNFEVLQRIETIASKPIDFFNGSYKFTDNGDLFYSEFKSVFIKLYNNEEASIINLPISDSIIYLDNDFIYDEEKELLYIVGLFVNKTSNGGKLLAKRYSSGYTWTKVNCRTNEVLESKKHLYSDELLNSFIENDNDSRIDDGLWLNNISKLHMDVNGDVLMILRNITIVSSQSKTPYRSRGASILNLNSEGDIKWNKSIYLYQAVPSPNSVNEFSTYKSGNLLFIYSSLLNHEKEGQIVNPSNNRLYVWNIDNNGELINKEVVSLSNMAVFLNENLYCKSNMIFLNAVKRDGLIKSNSFFFKIVL